MAVIAKPRVQGNISNNSIVSRCRHLLANCFAPKRDFADNEVPAEAFDRMMNDVATAKPSSQKELEAIDELMKTSRF